MILFVSRQYECLWPAKNKSTILYLVVIDEGLKKGRKFTDDFAVNTIKKMRKLLKDLPFKETVLHDTFLINEYENKEFMYQWRFMI